MVISYQNAPLFALPPASAWLAGETKTSPSGKPWIQTATGAALSMQPNGSLDTRPVENPDTYEPGLWETYQPSGGANVVTYTVNGLVFPLVVHG